MKKLYISLLAIVVAISGSITFAADDEAAVEEVVVTGSQIKGAKITGALPVSILSFDDIDALGIDSGDELLDNIAEFGQNTFNQNEFSGGYNASRGDVGAFNLRDIGTGNTLTLLNGRRLILSPGYQTEPILGGFMPVMTTNSNAIPIYGAERVEILRDGASAIYGADALAGVVNTVLKTDFVGFNVRTKQIAYDGLEAADNKVSIQWGQDFGENSNVSVYFDYYDRDEIRGNEDPKWLAQDARVSPGLGSYEGTAWDDTSWRNTNAASRYGIWRGGGDRYLHTRPDTGNCAWTGTGGPTCLYESTSTNPSDSLRAKYNETRWMRPDLERMNLFVFYNTELDNGVEAFTEIGFYNSKAHQQLYGGTTLGAGGCGKTGTCTQPYLIPLSNYWLNQIVDAEGNKLVDSNQITNELGLWKARHRFDTPRGYFSDRRTIRLLQGFRGATGNWDWETALVYSRAESEQNNYGRQSLTLLNEALAKSTPDAYNPFCGGLGCSDETPFTLNIVRDNTTDLRMLDFKISNPDIYDLPAGPVGVLFGAEIRDEAYTDNRDSRINGTKAYTVPVGPRAGLTFPLISDIVNSSATPNSSGSRVTSSLFAELQIPLTETIDMQYAFRIEDSDDYGDAAVSKLALGWQIIDQIKFRYSVSETFRAPALILVNEGFLGRSSTVNDALLDYASGENVDSYSMQRITEGNKGLEPEEGDNESIGFVIEPFDGLIITVDDWSIETTDTIGIFGMTNAVLLDTLIRAEGGASECVGNPNVTRSEYAGYDFEWPSALCPAGAVQSVNDYYVNTDTRTIEGRDTSVIYKIDTDVGNFGFKLMHVHYDTFYQEAGGDARRLSDAANGTLTGLASVRGIDNLLGLNGRIEDKYTMKFSYRNGPYELLLSGTKWGEFFESAHVETIDGVKQMWPVDEMTVINLTLGYKFEDDLRIRLQVKNIEDERAPLADETFSMFWGDLHTDFGRNYNLELYKKF